MAQLQSTAFQSLAAAMTLTLAVCLPVRSLLTHLAVLDRPTERSSHTKPTLRGGGLASGIGLSIAIVAVVGDARMQLLSITVIGLSYALIGMLDDFLSLSAVHRLCAQVALGAASARWLVQGSEGGAWWVWLLTATATFWLVGYVNAFNFMDGINGISISQVLTVGISTVAFGYHTHSLALTAGGAVLAGSALGFAPFNFPHAQMFLGDVGSYFYGAWIGAITVTSIRAGIPPLAACSPVLLYLADTSTTLCRRLVSGKSCLEPHRDHTYQQLVDYGWSHTRTTAFVLAASGTLSILGFLSIDSTSEETLLLLIVGSIVLCCYLALPSLVRPSAREHSAPPPLQLSSPTQPRDTASLLSTPSRAPLDALNTSRLTACSLTRRSNGSSD